MTKREWLDSLKLGDNVVLQSRGMMVIRPVESRNSRGRNGTIVVAGRNLDAGTGYERADGTRAGSYNLASIVPVTDEISAEIRERRALVRLQAVDWLAVPPAVRAKVCALLDEEPPCP